MSSGGVPTIPAGTGAGTGDLDAIFNKSLGDFDGAMEGEREVIAAAGGGSAKAAGQREQGDADAVAGAAGTRPDFESDAAGDASGADSGRQGSGGQSGTGMAGGTASQGAGGAGDQGTAGTMGKAGQPGSGVGEASDSEGKAAVKLPDDIPVDGSGDDVVGRQIREAAIAMQETNPQAAEKLWDEYRKHTGIK